jgi:hypothetical protein
MNNIKIIESAHQTNLSFQKKAKHHEQLPFLLQY